MSDENLQEELDAAFVRPGRTFRGQPLAPYTEGSRLLLLQVRDPQDSGVFFVYAFVFLHQELARDRRAAIRLAWDRDAFREQVLDWAGSFTSQDRDVAGEIVESMLQEASRASVEVVAAPAQAAIPPGNA